MILPVDLHLFAKSLLKFESQIAKNGRNSSTGPIEHVFPFHIIRKLLELMSDPLASLEKCRFKLFTNHLGSKHEDYYETYKKRQVLKI